MRRTLAGLTTALLLGLGLPVGAGCAGPELSVPGAPLVPQAEPGPAVVSLVAGDPFVLQGRFFFDGCDDTGGSADGGCGAPAREEVVPRRDVALVLVQGAQTWELGARDAGPAATGYAARWDAVLPAGARPGPALLDAGGAQLKIVVASPR